MNERGSEPVIAASELGQHAFCARGWWLERVKGCGSAHGEEMADGRAAHQAHGRRVARCDWLQRLAHVLLALAILTGVIAILSLGWGR